MHMFRKSVAILLLCAATNALAGFFDGNGLVEYMREWEKYESREASAKSLVAGVFMGYVAGVADAYDEVTVCPAADSSVRQLSAAVARFLKANPARLAESADVLVKDALKQGFPCGR